MVHIEEVSLINLKTPDLLSVLFQSSRRHGCKTGERSICKSDREYKELSTPVLDTHEVSISKGMESLVKARISQ